MNDEVRLKLEALRADFAEVHGKPFSHFQCPILFRDKDVDLCKAHVVNQAFRDTARAWTVQRSDVDNFYGSNFESDFVSLQDAVSLTPAQMLAERAIAREFDPKILVDDNPVDYFVSGDRIPEQFTPIEFEVDGKIVRMGLKIAPNTFANLVGRKWELDATKDLMLSATVSLIKAAHLTLFHMLKYRYAMSAAGHFVGRQILGDFFLRNRDKPKVEVLKEAGSYFRVFANMVRPIQACGYDFQGTVSDKMLLICWGTSDLPWAQIIFIKTGSLLHAVMVPIFDQSDPVTDTFLTFLKNANDSISVAPARFDWSAKKWECQPEQTRLSWPKPGAAI